MTRTITTGEELEKTLGTKPKPENAGYITGQKPGSALPLNTKASEVKGEIDTWAHQLAQTLITEIEWKPPNPPTTPRILQDIANMRIGHFTESSHGEHFMDTAHHYAKLIKHTIHPQPPKRIRLGIPCHAPDCTGQYQALLLPWKNTLPDMTCSRDEEHRLTPYEWQRAQRRPKNYQPQFIQRLARELFE
ncbi:MAG TPA: hypothetical protein VK054_00915 [Beutenbergiaceae bacterium]|nr:hypothetical protein [Beutenbergiaceae bacterium]